jgi:hypothetical protein
MNGSTTLGKLGDALRWNVASVGVQALGGLALNVAIGRWFGEGGLGVFSQLVGLHILFSQLCSGALCGCSWGPPKPSRRALLVLARCLFDDRHGVVVIAAMLWSPLLLAMLPSATLAGAWWRACRKITAPAVAC